MGLAFEAGRLALGTSIQVWEFVDVPAVTAKLDPPGRHDGCFLPRSCHITGNIQGHELAWGSGGEALGRQHPVLLSLHPRPLRQLHAAVAPAVCDRPRADRPVPLERPGNGRVAARATSRRLETPTHPPDGVKTRPAAAS